MKTTGPSRLYSRGLIDYLEERSRLGLVLIEGDGSIVACNNGFTLLLGLDEKPLGRKLTAFLAQGSPPLPLPAHGYETLHLIFHTPSDGELFLSGYLFPQDGPSFIIAFEQCRMSQSELIVKMSKLNDQIVDITRELEKKNVALSEAVKTIKRIMNIDPLTELLNRRAFIPLLRKQIAFSKRHRPLQGRQRHLRA